MTTTPRAAAPAIATFRRLSVYVVRGWPALLGVAATGLAGTLLALLAPWPLKVVVDQVVGDVPRPGWLLAVTDLLPGSGSDRGLLAWTAAVSVLLYLGGWIVGLLSAYASIMLKERITYALAGDVFDRVQRLSARRRSEHGTGDLIRRTLVDAECVALLVAGTLLPVLVSLVSVGSVFGVLWALDAGLVLAALAVLPVTALALRHYTPLMTARSLEQQDIEGGLYNDLEQTLTAMPVVQAFGAEERMHRRFLGGTSRLLDAAVASVDVQMRFRMVVGGSTALATSAVFVLGGRSVLSGELTLGDIVLFLAYLGTLYGPVYTLMSSAESVQYAVGSATRVLEVLDAAPDVADRPGAHVLTGVRGHLELDGVRFGYDPDRPVLRDVSLVVEPGETVALVGPSGAGKTTLASLVPRFHDPDAGAVRLDGHDLRDVTLASLRDHVSIVPQEPFLFPVSIADNIAYGRPGATREEVERAARDANAHEFVSALADGYDTVVDERGASLSGGQRQRISIARALLKDAPLLVLDEPTSALDGQSERLLLEALDRLMLGRTTVIIAHRLSTVRGADRIVVLDEGRVVEQGTHRELRAARGLYARLSATRPARSTRVRQAVGG